MGRHLIGYEVQKVLAAVDRLSRAARRSREGRRRRICRGRPGGILCVAIDPRIDAALVSGYFDRRGRVWEEPIDRNVWSLLERFGDAEIASLVLPRHLVVEHSEVPPFTSGKGAWHTPAGSSVRAEFGRIPQVDAFPRPSLVIGTGDRRGRACLHGRARRFREAPRLRPGGRNIRRSAVGSPPPLRSARHARAVREIERHVQGLVRAAEHVRDQGFLFTVLPELTALRWSTEKTGPTLSPERFIEARPYRERFRRTASACSTRHLPLNPRTRKVAETPRWTAWDVVLDVWTDV